MSMPSLPRAAGWSVALGAVAVVINSPARAQTAPTVTPDTALQLENFALHQATNLNLAPTEGVELVLAARPGREDRAAPLKPCMLSHVIHHRVEGYEMLPPALHPEIFPCVRAEGALGPVLNLP